MLSALYICYRPSVSVSLSHGRISQNGWSWNYAFLPYSSPIHSSFCRCFILKFWRVPPSWGIKQGWGKKTSFMCQYLQNGRRYIFSYHYWVIGSCICAFDWYYFVFIAFACLFLILKCCNLSEGLFRIKWPTWNCTTSGDNHVRMYIFFAYIRIV